MHTELRERIPQRSSPNDDLQRDATMPLAKMTHRSRKTATTLRISFWTIRSDGAMVISPAQLSYMLEGIDWRNPIHTFRPQAAG